MYNQTCPQTESVGAYQSQQRLGVADAPRPMTPFEEANAVCEKEMAELASSFQALAARLAPVLRDDPTCPQNEKDCPRNPVMSRAVSLMHEKATFMRNLAMGIRIVMDRLEV